VLVLCQGHYIGDKAVSCQQLNIGYTIPEIGIWEEYESILYRRHPIFRRQHQRNSSAESEAKKPQDVTSKE
jgi:hypothetical protein